MAGFLNLHNSEFAAKGVAEYNAQNGNGGHTFLGYTLATNLPSIFMSLTSKIAEKSDGKGGAGKSDDEIRKEQSKKLNNYLKAIGATDENDINEAVSRAQDARDTKVNAAQAEVDAFVNETDKYSIEIANLKMQLVSGTELTDEQNKNNAKINSKIEKLEEKKKDALQKAKSKLIEITKTENEKLDAICEKASQALAVLDSLENFNALEGEDVKVEETTEALNEFATHRNILNSKTETLEIKQYAARRIQQLAEANPNNKTLQNAYTMITTQVNDILNGNNYDKYKTMDTKGKVEILDGTRRICPDYYTDEAIAASQQAYRHSNNLNDPMNKLNLKFGI